VSGDAPFQIEQLADHDRSTFESGVSALDSYFRFQVGQDIRRRVANCFVAVDTSDRVVGFYTLAATGIAPADLPEEIARRLPRYPSIPAYRIGRLAVDLQARGRKLGAALLADAFLRMSRAEAAGYALVVDAKDGDAKDGDAAAFYRHHGFIELLHHPLSLFLPLGTAARLLKP
jgi:GNAT superfamily N-acetyltransferase